MKRQTLIHVLIYGLGGGIMIVLLRLIEFKFLIVEHSIEIYGGLVAALFAGLGIWVGLKLTKKKEVLIVREVPVPAARSRTFWPAFTSMASTTIRRQRRVCPMDRTSLTTSYFGATSSNIVATSSGRFSKDARFTQ